MLRQTALFILILLFVVVFAYNGSLNNQLLHWDDHAYLLANPYIRTFTWENLRVWLGFYAGNWTPLTWASHALGYAWFGEAPYGHHLLNLILHCVNSVWVFFVAHELFRRVWLPPHGSPEGAWWAAVVASLLFAAHPQHVEVVAWVAARKDLLSVFFVLPSLYAYLRYTERSGNRGGYPWYGASIFGFALSLAAKPSVMMFPFVLLLLDVYPLRRTFLLQGERPICWRRVLAEKLPFLALAFGVGLLALFGQNDGGAITGEQVFSLPDKILNMGNNFLFYPYKFFVPLFFSPLYVLTKSTGILPWLAVLAITLLCVFAWRRGHPAYLIAWLSYSVALLPVSGIIQFGPQSAADRFAYWATLPFYLLVGAGVVRVWCRGRRFSKMALSAGVVCVLAMLLALTRQQTLVWQNDLVFWHYVVAATPQNSVAQAEFANAWLRIGQPDKALEHYHLALQVGQAQGMIYELPSIYQGIGLALWERGQKAEARDALAKALELAPGNTAIARQLGELSRAAE